MYFINSCLVEKMTREHVGLFLISECLNCLAVDHIFCTICAQISVCVIINQIQFEYTASSLVGEQTASVPPSYENSNETSLVNAWWSLGNVSLNLGQ